MPHPGLTWLVVLEAHWQRTLDENEFAFGRMLHELFARVPWAQVRHRFYHDEASLVHWCRQLVYLPEPAVLVITGHGETNGLTVDGNTIAMPAVIETLRLADSLKLLHFSACLVGQDAGQALEAAPFPVSGYTTSVDWAQSALTEFIYLDMILEKGLAPAKAAEQLLALVRFAGTRANFPARPTGPRASASSSRTRVRSWRSPPTRTAARMAQARAPAGSAASWASSWGDDPEARFGRRTSSWLKGADQFHSSSRRATADARLLHFGGTAVRTTAPYIPASGVEPDEGEMAASAVSAVVGNSRRTVVPPPSLLSILISPALCCTKPRTWLRPRPLPPFRVVKNGSKTRSCTSRDIPTPSSRTTISAHGRAGARVRRRVRPSLRPAGASASRTSMTMWPPSGIASLLFSTRFKSADSRWIGSSRQTSGLAMARLSSARGPAACLRIGANPEMSSAKSVSRAFSSWRRANANRRSMMSNALLSERSASSTSASASRWEVSDGRRARRSCARS